jgi:outer membrane protein OmpA-like peptidoglycan-associated protein
MEKVDPPAVVIRAQDPREKMPVATSGLKAVDENSMKAGTQYDDESPAPERVATSQGQAPQVQRFYILFKPGSAELENRSFDVLMKVSQLISAKPNSKITLSGFSDSTAKSGYSGKLSALRANCVKSFLASQGLGVQLPVVRGSAENLLEINNPAAVGDVESWSEIRIETGKEG